MKKQINNDEILINMHQIVHDVKTRIITVMLVSVLTAAAAFAITYLFIEPKYEAVASMYVNNSSFSFGSTSFSISSSELSASNSLAQTYIYLLNSRTTLEAVISDTGIDYTYEELRKHVISSTVISGTAAFEVTVTSSDPSEAELIANSVAKILPERISEIVDGSSVRIVDYAIIPAHRASPSYTKSVLIGGFSGAFMALLWIVIKSIVRETEDRVLRSADDITDLFPQLRVLSVIPDMQMTQKKGYYYYSSYYGSSKKSKGHNRKGDK